MKQTLLITTLIFAGVTNVWAIAAFDIWGGGNHNKLNSNESNKWIYTSVQESNYGANYEDLGWRGEFQLDGKLTTNQNNANTHLIHHRKNTTIHLNKDARYEVNFEFYLSQGGSTGDQAMAGMYLAGDRGSVFFGNVQRNRNDDRRDAVLVKYEADIAEGNDDNLTQIYFPNGEFSSKLSAPFYYNAPHSSQFYTVVNGNTDNAFDSGNYKLTLIIESFADANTQDMLYLYASTPDGTSSFVAQQGLLGLGFTTDAYFDAYGFVLHNDGASTATAQKMAGYEYARSLKPTEVVPDIPEPSAFGLLAGIGGLALVAVRRRRSRS